MSIKRFPTVTLLAFYRAICLSKNRKYLSTENMIIIIIIVHLWTYGASSNFLAHCSLPWVLILFVQEQKITREHIFISWF